jgi:hypothetical protein
LPYPPSIASAYNAAPVKSCLPHPYQVAHELGSASSRT